MIRTIYPWRPEPKSPLDPAVLMPCPICQTEQRFIIHRGLDKLACEGCAVPSQRQPEVRAKQIGGRA